MDDFSPQDLLNIVAAGSSLDERLAKGFLPGGAQTSETTVKARLDAWSQAVAQGDRNQFRQRLAWDSLGEDMVSRVLSVAYLPENQALPRWADTLGQVVRQAVHQPLEGAGAGRADTDVLSLLDAREPFPFEELLAPFVLLAQRRCEAQAGESYHLLCDRAHIYLQRALLQTLTTYAVQTLYLEFCIYRGMDRSPWGRLLEVPRPDDGRTRYQQFVERTRRSGFTALFREYTVLARLLCTITDLWVESTVEFLRRLAGDLPEIQRVFGSEGELGRVTSVQPSLSDPHRGRRQVLALAFASGCKVVYKPKDLGTEDVYYRLLGWLNDRGAPLPLRVLKVLNRCSHGWVEFVEHEPCRDPQEARRYYERAGMLLCLIYVLEGTDCHYENIIASGEHPVLVDMETLMHHRPRLQDEGNGARAQALANEQVASSVLHTGLLPRWQVLSDSQTAYDVSGLGATADQELVVPTLRWEHVNTDRMTLQYGPVKGGVPANGPTLDGAPLSLGEHTAEVVVGFQRMYRFLLDQRAALLSAESPLSELGRQQVRFVYRATHVYFSIAQRLLHPRYLRDGAERSIQLELLGRSVVPLEGPSRDRAKPSHWWPVFAAERQAMERTDVPFFTARPSSRDLTLDSDREVKGCFQEPSR